MSLDLFIAQARTILIHDKESVESYSKLNKKQNLCYLVKSIKLCCMVLNEITYGAELEQYQR